eukprot:gb/GECH01002375.1/.p1 GENE.gb/GECH01002375.1/~~gb/GECH01002375.1/.p1  ORF type:complete len:533 (+),score=113.26 gb/GECH01002375.1/:1-1599(+)
MNIINRKPVFSFRSRNNINNTLNLRKNTELCVHTFNRSKRGESNTRVMFHSRGSSTSNIIDHKPDGTVSDTVMSNFNKAAALIDPSARIHPGNIDRIRNISSALTIRYPFDKGDDDYEVIEGGRVEHSYHEIPAKGGLRICPWVTHEDCAAIALVNSMQYALADIPWAGAKGYIKIDPTLYSKRELKRIVQQYATLLVQNDYLKPGTNIMCPGFGSGSMEMSWILAMYKTLRNTDINHNASVLGKPWNHGGIRGHHETQGLSVIRCLQSVFNSSLFPRTRLSPNIRGKTAIIHGFGFVGHSVARAIVEHGGLVVGIAEHDGAVFNRTGINVDDAKRFFEKHDSLRGFLRASHLSSETLLEFPSDIIILASRENIIHSNNADRVQAPIIAETAVGAVTSPAEDRLTDRGVLVLPDICLGTGMEFLAYQEWLKSLSHVRLGRLQKRYDQRGRESYLEQLEKHTNTAIPVEDLEHISDSANELNLVRYSMEEGIQSIFRNTIREAEKSNVSLRIAAYYYAIKKLGKSFSELGCFP